MKLICIVVFLIIVFASYQFLTESKIENPVDLKTEIPGPGKVEGEKKNNHPEKKLQVLKAKEDKGVPVEASQAPGLAFSDWSSDEAITDTVYEQWGNVIQEPFFDPERGERLISEAKVHSDKSEFLKQFKSGIYKGYFLQVHRDKQAELDPQPVYMNLKKLIDNDRSYIQVDWITWKKSTNADGTPYVTVKDDHRSPFLYNDEYASIITVSNKLLTAMFLAYFGGPHDCKEGTIFISTKRSNLPEKIEGDLHCRLSRDNFILVGLVSLSFDR